MIKNIFKNKGDRGYTLLFAVLVSSLVLSVGISILTISKKEYLLASSARESTSAIYAADSALECAVYWDYEGRIDPSTNISGLKCGNSTAIGANWLEDPDDVYRASFHVSFGNNDSCAIVTVTKDSDSTNVLSKGYNMGWNANTSQCDTASPRRVERALSYNSSAGTAGSPIPPGDPRLTVNVEGIGGVNSVLSVDTCTVSCDYQVPVGTNVTLTASGSGQNSFDEWTGDIPPSCQFNNACNLTVSESMTVTAHFSEDDPNAFYSLSILSGLGVNHVGSNPTGINCGNGSSDCAESYADGTPVTLTATPGPGFTFKNWAGDGVYCFTNPLCGVSVTQTKTIYAFFDQIPVGPTTYSITVNNSSNGANKVTSVPSGIDCGNTCYYGLFPAGSIATTTASYQGAVYDGEFFMGWTGADASFCTYSTRRCVFNMTQDRSVNAVYADALDLFITTTDGSGRGLVQGAAGINCGPDCTYQNVAFPPPEWPGWGLGNTYLGVIPEDENTVFVRWAEDVAYCGTLLSCDISSITDGSIISAIFDKIMHPLTITKPVTNGTIQSTSPAGVINCGSGGSTCNASLAQGSTITLSAVGNATYVINQWTGDAASCGSSPTCNVTITGAKTVGATFKKQ